MRLAAAAGAVCMTMAGVLPAQAAGASGWRVFTTVTDGSAPVAVGGIDAISASDAWATWMVQRGAKADPLVLRWNGRSWRTAALPDSVQRALGSGFGYPISASSATNVWVSSPRGWARWTGSGWQSGTFPVIRRGETSQDGFLLAFGPKDVWLIGGYFIGAKEVAFALRYDGRRWHTMPSPGITGFQVSASSPDAICVVNGNYGSPVTAATTLKCWNGKGWHSVRLPASLDAAHALIGSILVGSLSNIWLGGGTADAGGIRGIAGHWNGKQWQVRTLPVVPTLGDDVLNQLTSDGHHGLWAIGDCDCGGPAWRLWHYTGGRWTGPASPAIGGVYGLIGQISAVPGTDSAWAAATRGTAKGSEGVILLDGRTPR
jgi:hypothetical protein